MSVALGQIVISKAGRDAGKKFIVVKVVDDLFVMVSDGSLRRLEKPKRKKIKHLEPTEMIAEAIAEKLRSNARISNSEIRKTLGGQEETLENGS